LYVTLLGVCHPRLASRNKRQGVLETWISFGRSRSGWLCRKAALGAAMRKLLMIAFGVLKSRKEFCVPAAQAAA